MGHGISRYRRVTAMSPQEIADRLKQQISARLDFLRYRAGMNFESRLTGVSLRDTPCFFFSAEDIPQLCARLRQLFPDECRSIIERAESICRHRFDFLGYKNLGYKNLAYKKLGYKNLDYGPEIDWHFDRVHAKQAPRKPFFRIRYLDFAEVGDSKVTWELSRHQHLVTLAKAYRLTGDEKFARELFAQFNSWHRENPYPIGINWASSLEVAFRSLSWLWVYYLTSGSPAMPAGFRDQLLGKLSVAGRHLENNLSTYFSPNTHLLGEGAALFFLGTLCPEVSQAKRWQHRGWQILQQAAERQVRSDGLHFEQSLYYHVYALDFFIHAYALASRNGIVIPAAFHRTIESMLDALCTLGRAGPVPRLGDDDGGRLFDPQRNRTEHLLDPLATGAVLFRRSDFKAVAGGPREETLWLLGESGLNTFERLPSAPVAPASTSFSDAGLYLMADDASHRQLIIDAGPQGADSAGHGHADALSITANAFGRPLLIDPGTFEYVGETQSERNRFRGTRAHNTLVVDGLDQSPPKGPFSWGALPNVRAEQWINGENFDLFVGRHDGYQRLADPVIHRRTVFSLRPIVSLEEVRMNPKAVTSNAESRNLLSVKSSSLGSGFWLVRDQALGQAEHALDLSWHLSPELLPHDQSKATFHAADVALSVLTPANQGWAQSLHPEDWSPAYGQKQPHSVLHFETKAKLPAELATLFVPQQAISPNVSSFERTDSPGDSFSSYRWKISQQDHNFVFGQGTPWTCASWSSDAEFLYWCESRDQDQPRCVLIFCGASYLRVGGRRLLSSERKIVICELVNSNGKVKVISTDPEATIDGEAFRAVCSERPKI